MRDQCCPPIAYFLFAFILSGGLLGSAIGNYLDNREAEKIMQKLDESIIQSKKDLVDSAIIIVEEIYLETTDAIRIARSLETAKLFSADAGCYGAERIQEIENRLKQKHPLNNKQ